MTVWQWSRWWFDYIFRQPVEDRKMWKKMRVADAIIFKLTRKDVKMSDDGTWAVLLVSLVILFGPFFIKPGDY